MSMSNQANNRDRRSLWPLAQAQSDFRLPKTPFEESLRRTGIWYLEHRQERQEEAP
jgi:hypothetical protein